MSEKVGVVMPARNVSQWIARAIKSVLAQRVYAWHLVVVDDGSQDDTLKRAHRILDSHRINLRGTVNVISRPAAGVHGVSQAVAVGMELLAKSADPPDIVMAMGADDLLSEDYVMTVLQTMRLPGTVCVYPVVCEFGSSNGLWVSDYDPGALRTKNVIPGCAAWKRWVWNELGGFDQRFLHGGEDWEFAARAETRGYFHALPPKTMPRGAVYYHRMRPGSLTTGVDDSYKQWVAAEVAKKYPAPVHAPSAILAPVSGDLLAIAAERAS